MRAGREFFSALHVVARNPSEVVAEDGLAFEQIEAVSGETSTVGEDDAFGSAFRDDDFRLDAPRFVLGIRCGAFGDADETGEVGEGIASGGEAGAVRHVEALDLAVINRQDIVFLGFLPEEFLEFFELRGFFRGEVVSL